MEIREVEQSAFRLPIFSQKKDFIIPATGVYAVRMLVQDEWVDGVCNVGYKPTFKNPEEKQLTIEVHFFNFDKNIYGEEVFVDWYHHIRDEQKFDGIDSLKHKLKKINKQPYQSFQKSNVRVANDMNVLLFLSA